MQQAVCNVFQQHPDLIVDKGRKRALLTVLDRTGTVLVFQLTCCTQGGAVEIHDVAGVISPMRADPTACVFRVRPLSCSTM
jgi:hypothetical protein